jgi:thymidine phosphorylase
MGDVLNVKEVESFLEHEAYDTDVTFTVLLLAASLLILVPLQDSAAQLAQNKAQTMPGDLWTQGRW